MILHKNIIINIHNLEIKSLIGLTQNKLSKNPVLIEPRPNNNLLSYKKIPSLRRIALTHRHLLIKYLKATNRNWLINIHRKTRSETIKGLIKWRHQVSAIKSHILLLIFIDKAMPICTIHSMIISEMPHIILTQFANKILPSEGIWCDHFSQPPIWANAPQGQTQTRKNSLTNCSPDNFYCNFAFYFHSKRDIE